MEIVRYKERLCFDGNSLHIIVSSIKFAHEAKYWQAVVHDRCHELILTEGQLRRALKDIRDAKRGLLELEKPK